MREKYKLLSAAPLALKVLAWGSIVLSVIGAIVIFMDGEDANTPHWMGVIALLGGMLNCFLLLVASDFINLQFDISDGVKV